VHRAAQYVASTASGQASIRPAVVRDHAGKRCESMAFGDGSCGSDFGRCRRQGDADDTKSHQRGRPKGRSDV